MYLKATSLQLALFKSIINKTNHNKCMLKSSVVVELFMYTQAIILAHNRIIESNVNFM